MLRLKIFIICCFVLLAQSGIAQKAPQTNATEHLAKPYVILISADGFRHDYAERYNAQNILNAAKTGVRAASMIPSFPASTHANHFTLVSGLYPAHSGIVGNSFYDPARKEKFKASDGTWFKKDPIWVTAEKQGMLTASLSFIDSRQPVNGYKPSYYVRYSAKMKPIEERVKVIKKWLDLPEAERPHFIAFYIPEADHAGHEHGPDSEEVKQTVAFIDTLIGKLNDAIKATSLPVSVVFTSDHGMTAITKDSYLEMPSIDTAKFIAVNQYQHLNLYAKDKSFIRPAYEQLKENAKDCHVYLKKDVPADFHYGSGDDHFNRIGDIVITNNWPKTFYDGPIEGTRGVHGYNGNDVKDMHAIFYAWGPAFKSALQIRSFENVEVYGAIMRSLGLKAEPNDGKGWLAKEILR